MTKEGKKSNGKYLEEGMHMPYSETSHLDIT